MATQLTKGQLDLSKLFGIAFIGNGGELAVADVTSTSSHLAAQGTDLFFVKSAAVVKNNAEDGVEEINGVQIPTVEGETRLELTLCVGQDDWNNLQEYDAFSCGKAYFYLNNKKVAYISDGDATTPKAMGLPLNMVRKMKHPLFQDGATAATFKLQVNVESTLLGDIEFATLDAPVTLLG